MANPEHLAVLREGVLTWNRWRTVNPSIGVDLSGADLSGALIAASTTLDLPQVSPAEHTNTEVIIAPGQSHDHSP